MNHYRPLKIEDIPCMAHHKGLAYAEVKVLKYDQSDNTALYSYDGDYFNKHRMYADIKHFVIKIKSA